MCTYIKAILLLLSVSNVVNSYREIPANGICWELEKVDSITIPKEKCCDGFKYVNGKCVEANNIPECPCPAGTQFCDCESTCDTICENGICIAPNVCQCNEGYVMDDEFGECRPICNPSCVNGECSAPNQCICFDGHKLRRRLKFECIPEGHIDCDDGYNYEDGICKPLCSPSCVNGKCVGPNQCACDEGYEPRQDAPYECIPVSRIECRYGYQLENGDCTPICNPECKNGRCRENNQCVCYEGYKRKYGSRHECIPDNEPICEPDCVHGKCIGNICECDRDYLMDPNERNVCSPACGFSDYCANGTCVNPGTCTCNSGFRFSNDDKNTCEPIDHHRSESTYSKAYLRPLSQNIMVKVWIQVWRNQKDLTDNLHEDQYN